MSRPRLSRLTTWEDFEDRILEVFIEALLILQTKTSLPQAEINLNRELYWCLLEANHKLYQLGRGLDKAPISEAKNPPDPDDEQRTKRENKIPDFLWGYIDHIEPDPKRSAHHYYIECKRLGKPPRSDWVLNENYVQHGIARFITEDHGYAKGEESGAMVGYVQNMEFDDILNEVNTAANTASIPVLTRPVDDWQQDGTSRLIHQLDRPFPISPFSLHHLWIDLRNCYGNAS